MNRRKFERGGKGVSKNGQTPAASAVGKEAAPYQMIHPQKKPLRPMVIGRTVLYSHCWALIFEQATSLSRSERQTADNLVHRATQSKMTVFKTTPCFGVMVRTKPIFRSSGGLRKNEQTPGIVDFNAARRCMSGFSHRFGDWANWGGTVLVTPRRRILSRFVTRFHGCQKCHPSE
mgnify:CR=1 FL=1